jgi:putative transposase
MNSLSASQRATALQRYQILKPFLEDTCTLPEAIKLYELPIRTARRWVAQYRTMGLPGLARSSRSDKGQHRQLSHEVIQLIEGLALQKPPLSKAAIHRRVQVWAKAANQFCPSYTMVSNTIDRLEPGLVMLAHEGSKAYKEAFDLLYRREADRPNAIWQADHTLLDIWLRDEKGKAVRPWLTIIIDDYSRAIAGYALFSGAPSAYQTALALRHAIWRKAESNWQICGIPEVLYTDHGSDFTSQHLEQVCADLKIQAIFSQVRQPRGRGKIERFFQTVNQMLLCQLPGYIASGSEPKAVLTFSEFTTDLQNFIATYHHRPHGTTNIEPHVRWSTHGFVPVMPDSLEQLDLLLLTVAKPRTVHQDGIRFQGLFYIDVTLAAYVGAKVTIRYDPRDLAEIRVYHNNQFLCRAICPELASTTVSLKDIENARNQRRRALRKEIKERQSLVDSLTQQKAEAKDVTASVIPDSLSAQQKPKLKRYLNE